MKGRIITQKTVAERAGVSQALVSLVMNSTGEVAHETRERILKAAEELGYKTRRRREGNTRPSRVLAYIRPVVARGHHDEHWIYDSYDEFYDRIQKELLEAAYEHGYSLIVRPYEADADLTHWLSEWGVDGVVWHGPDRKLARWIMKRYPMIQLNRHMLMDVDAVSSNQEEIITIAMDHLCSMGHKRVVYLPFGSNRNPLLKMRYRAYLDYLREHSLPGPPKGWVERESFGFSDCDAYLASQLALPRSDRATAFIVGTHYALKLMKEASVKGYSIPGDFSLIGIDHVTAANYTTPALSVVDTRNDVITRLAVGQLLKRIKNPGEAIQKIAVTPRLIERESVTRLGDNLNKGKEDHGERLELHNL